MAITAATLTSDFSGFIPAEISAPIFERAARMSVMMQLGRQVDLGFAGKSIPVVTGRPVAGWTAEGAKKPATQGTMTLASMVPKKLAAILVVSMETVRANPGQYVTSAREQLAEAFAIAFDYATFHNLGGDGTGTGPFATYVDQTTKSQELGGSAQASGGVYQDLVGAAQEIIADTDASGRRYRFTGSALDVQMEMRLRGAVDTSGRPIWSDLPLDQDAPALNVRGSLLGRPSFLGEGVADASNTVLGYLGDFSQVAWGAVGGISFSVSDQATVTINGSLVSLWEQNLVAIRAEAEYGFVMPDADAFVQLRNDSGS